MAIKPILFNNEMVRAILDGRKSCTRRLVKHDVESVLNSPYHKAHPEVEDKQIISKLWNPPYHTGDILYVRETWQCIWIKITDVRIERLQEMKPVDVIKEGAYPDCWDCLNTYGESGSQCCYGTEEQCSQCDEVMMEWEKLWNSTIKKSDLDCYGWNANPWVWEIEFERCEKPEGV